MTIGTNLAGRRGFTLVEALVALTVLAVASAGLIRATEAHVDQVRGLQIRTIAQWVAENRLVEIQVGQAVPVARTDRVDMLGRSWDVAVGLSASEDPDLAAVTVAVSPAGASRSSVVLTGFVDIGKSAA
jgi:general secretion pathway protein I